MLKYRVTIDGRQRMIEVARHEGALEVSVDGVHVDADLREVQPGRYSLRLDGRQFDAMTLRAPGKLAIHLGSELFRAEIQDARRPEIAAGSKLARPFELTAPMPGKVVRILVSEGQKVTPDSGIVVVEAMKMENELRAGSAARVEAILVKPGQLVDSGVALVRFAPAGDD